VSLYLPRNLAGLAKIASNDPGRYALAAVRVLDPGDGTYRLEATDGRRLAVVRGDNERAAYPAVEEAPFPPGPAALIPLEEWGQAFRLGVKHRPVGLTLGEQDFLFAVETASFAGKPAEGRYPDFAPVLPQAAAVVSFRVNPDVLAGLLSLAKGLGMDAIHVLWWSPGHPVGLAGQNDQGQFLDALLMPLS
jgi:hypothetical protein